MPLQVDDWFFADRITYVYRENSRYNQRFEQRMKMKKLLGPHRAGHRRKSISEIHLPRASHSGASPSHQTTARAHASRVLAGRKQKAPHPSSPRRDAAGNFLALPRPPPPNGVPSLRILPATRRVALVHLRRGASTTGVSSSQAFHGSPATPDRRHIAPPRLARVGRFHRRK